jgi:hypothetical protein
VSEQPTLRTRVIEAIRAHQPLPARELTLYLADVSDTALDCAVTSLLRSKTITRLGGYYDVAGRAPTAMEEAEASLSPPGLPLFECKRCGNDRPDSEFQHSKLGTRFSVCIPCVRAGRKEPSDAPGAAAVVTAPSTDSLLEQKRAALTAKREQLTADYESQLKALIDRIDAIDHVLAEMKRLSEEPL